MKFRNLKKWDDVDNSRGLILFAQLIDELLFEYTLDTYKPSAMNSSLLIKEAKQTYVSIESGSVKKPNLQHVLDELCENLDSDIIAKSLLSVDLDGIKSVFKDRKSSDISKITVIKLLENQVPLNLYKKMNEELLIKHIEGDQSASVIRSLARNYITTLLNSGFSEKYIQEVSRKYFHYSKDRISGNSAIRDYLMLFEVETKKYSVIYRAADYLMLFSDAAKMTGIEVTKTLGDLEKVASKYNYKLKNKDIYLLVKCAANDPRIAKTLADKEIEQLQTLIGLYHHKKSPKLISEGLIVFPDKEEGKIIDGHFNPMHKCKDLTEVLASKRLKEFIKGFSMERDSFRKFNRSAELHALALGSDSSENQLINLWIALESLIPAKDDGDLAQIEHVSKSVMPFLNLNYIYKIVSRLSKDLNRWDSRVTKQVLRQVDGAGFVEKTFHLLALEKYAEQRDCLRRCFGDFALLEERYNYVESVFSSPAGLVHSMERHTKRVDWQLRRIYRARNMIVHDGVTPSYIEILIENLHDYLDSIFSTLMNLASQEHVLNSTDQGFKVMDISYRSYAKALSKKGLEFDEENIDQLLFGFLGQNVLRKSGD